MEGYGVVALLEAAKEKYELGWWCIGSPRSRKKNVS